MESKTVKSKSTGKTQAKKVANKSSSSTKKSESVVQAPVWSENLLALVQIRGTSKVDERVKYTLKLLGLNDKFNCVLIPDTESYRGMIQKIKDFITWGKIDKETFDQLVEKRFKGKRTFRLSPPRGGFERGGIKKTFKQGGVLGLRENIGSLILKMI